MLRNKLPNLSGNSPQIYECYLSIWKKKIKILLFSQNIVSV